MKYWINMYKNINRQRQVPDTTFAYAFEDVCRIKFLGAFGKNLIGSRTSLFRRKWLVRCLLELPPGCLLQAYIFSLTAPEKASPRKS